jgi:hypothetical protein
VKTTALSRQEKKAVEQLPYFEARKEKIWMERKALANQEGKMRMMALSRQNRK